MGIIRNHGVIHAPKDGRDWRLGGLSGAERVIIRPDGQWRDFLPEREWQNRFGLETMGCVSYAYLNVVETIFKQRGIVKNFSDRFLAKVDGTTREGNYVLNAAKTASKMGLLDEAEWPWPPDSDTWDEYYAEVPAPLVEKAGLLLKEWAFNYEWVDPTPEAMKAALQFSPLQVTNYGHCFTVIGYEEGVLWRTFDTYGECSGTLPWSYKFYSAMAHYVSPVKPPNPIVMQFTEGVLYQLVEGKGGFFLFAAGKLRKDDTALLLASWEVRNGGDTKGKVGTLTLANLEGVELFDLKGQPTSL